MNEIDRIANQINLVYLEGFWGGGSIRELFLSLKAPEAAAHPISDAHSAWDIALHIAVWWNIFRRRILGENVENHYDNDWPKPDITTDQNWRQTIANLDKAHKALVNAVRTVKLEELNKKIAGKNFTLYEMLHGVTQHDQYHAGQVLMLKKAMKGISLDE